MFSLWLPLLAIWFLSTSVCFAQSVSPGTSANKARQQGNPASYPMIQQHAKGSPAAITSQSASAVHAKREGQKPTSDSAAGPTAVSTPASTLRKSPEVSRIRTKPDVDSRVTRAGYRQEAVPSRNHDQERLVVDDQSAPTEPILLLPMDSGTNQLHLPLNDQESEEEINFEQDGDLLTLSFRDASLRVVLGVLAESQGLNLICSDGADTKITGNFHSITFKDAMNTVMSVSGYTWTRRNNVIIVTPLTNELKLAPEAQGRIVRVFTLNYVSSADVLKSCTGLLSPSGTVVGTESDPKNGQRTLEQLIVEDLPDYVERIAELIAQLDVQPRQVLIEAHILEVTLKDEFAHGVDFAKLASIAGTDILLASPGFNGTITDLSTFAAPSYNVGVFNAGSFSGLIQALQKTTDAKTLASPKVLALNGQEAHVQIGKRLGYYVTTTTQTSSLQSVQFLDTGIVLTVVPKISVDGQIMMTVKPEVSDGSVDSIGLPSSTTTEVETSIMLPDGKGMVIGGLIKETDITNQQKIPVLGSLWMVGKLFRKNSVTRERSEIIIALVPHIVDGSHFDNCREEMEFQRTTTPLLAGPLEPVPRPWEAKLPDAMDNPRRLDASRVPQLLRHPSQGPPNHLEHYFPTEESRGSDSIIFSGPVPQMETWPIEDRGPDDDPTEDLNFDMPTADSPFSKSTQ